MSRTCAGAHTVPHGVPQLCSSMLAIALYPASPWGKIVGKCTQMEKSRKAKEGNPNVIIGDFGRTMLALIVVMITGQLLPD